MCCERVCTLTQCFACDYTACKKCVKTYLLNQTTVPDCMNCNVVFTRSTLIEMTSAAWLSTTYAKHREGVLLQEAKALLPSTEPHVLQIEKREKHMRRISVLQDKRRRLAREMANLTMKIRQENTKMPQKLSESLFHFICGNGSCNGVLDANWTCRLCSKVTCSECGCVKEAGHVCNDDDKLTAEVLKTCRPCPWCSALTHRIDGCAHMWCIKCHKSWDWHSGRKIKRNVHNPERMQYEARNAVVSRNPGDIPCGGLPHVSEFTVFRGPTFTRCFELYRFVKELEDTHLPRYLHEQSSSLPLRIELLRGNVDEKHVQKTLFRSEIKEERCREIFGVVQMMIHTISDILRQLLVNRVDPNPQLEEINNIIKIGNESLLNISKTFKCRVPQVGPQLRIMSALRTQ